MTSAHVGNLAQNRLPRRFYSKVIKTFSPRNDESKGFTLIEGVRLPIKSEWRSSSDSVKPRGFTLIELMVVIAIIAILSVVGITIFSNAQKSARDAKRRADIDAIANAMELHYGSLYTGRYSGLCEVTPATPTYDCAQWFAGGSIPVDPNPSEVVRAYRWCDTGIAGCTQNQGGALGNCAPRGGCYSGNAGYVWTVCAVLTNGQDYCKQNQQ